MKVRPDLTNKVRSGTEAGTGGSGAKVIGHSFSNIFSEQAARKSVAQDFSPANSGRSVVAPSNRATTHRAHPANARHHKEITVTQANRLAKYSPVIQESSKKYNVPVELICGVILQESGGNHKAVSHAGARGLMQLMPATAKRFGVTNSFDARQNIDGGTKYLRFLLDRFKGDYRLALAGYNAGERNVEKYGNKVPPFAETRAYVPNVLAYADTIWSALHPQPSAQVASATLPTFAKKV